MIQGSTEWLEARIGKITSSRFKDVMTKGTKGNEFGQTAMSYAFEILAEVNTGKPISKNNSAIDHGNYFEDEARVVYEMETVQFVEQCGFIGYNNIAGGSPDGLVGDDGIIEIKCPYNPARHQATLSTKKPPIEYGYQMQGNLMVTGRKWCDYVSYHPDFKEGLQIVIIRIERNDEMMNMMWERIQKFWDLLNLLGLQKIN